MPEVETTVKMPVLPAATVRTVLAPEDWTVTAPLELLTMVNDWPSTSVETTGRVTVWVVEPVKYCSWALDTVSVVVPAAVTVVA